MAQEWTRIEGMIIGHDLDPSVVAGELKERSILAQLEWFPSSPQMLGLNVAVDEERVATVPAGPPEVVPGPTPAELADELAILFDAEVRIGNATADHLPEGDSPLGKVWPSDEEAAAVDPHRRDWPYPRLVRAPPGSSRGRGSRRPRACRGAPRAAR